MMTFLGLLGAACVLSMYAMLESGRMSSSDPRFYMVNGVGALLVAISIAADYDSADVGGIVVEAVWVVISVFGIVKYLRKQRVAND